MMATVQAWLDYIWEFFRSGFHDVNQILGLLIAIVAAYFLSKYSRIFVIALGALVFYIVAEVMIPVVANHAEFKLPNMVDEGYWQRMVAIYAGFLLIITVFYVAKKFIFRGGH
jgi:hypothetical protein